MADLLSASDEAQALEDLHEEDLPERDLQRHDITHHKVAARGSRHS